MQNTFYAVSTGPGGSKFLTLEAVEVLKNCKTIFYPLTKADSKNHIAFDTINEVKNLFDLDSDSTFDSKRFESLVFSMTKNQKVRQNEYDEAQNKILEALKDGNCAFVSIGDVSIYSTSARISKMIETHGVKIEFVSGVTSFCAAAATAKIELSLPDEEIRIIPGDKYFSEGKIDEVLGAEGTKVFMKSARFLKEILKKVKNASLLENSTLVRDAGQPNELLVCGSELLGLSDDFFKDSYMSILIVKGRGNA
ncbi:precorrin-2 C(20)-methyltransferase [Treponema zioleckii]|uniref:precorrin-2 C(20)-methyltransferase n=1 Tax=Treponema zioleckii TaxID=331680 RepID=UPI00168BD113|nr:precorrin-2 C(20)-methyltransferase [Treponema zioleckii]